MELIIDSDRPWTREALMTAVMVICRGFYTFYTIYTVF